MRDAKYYTKDLDYDRETTGAIYTFSEAETILKTRELIISSSYRFAKTLYEMAARFICVLYIIGLLGVITFAASKAISWYIVIIYATFGFVLTGLSYSLKLMLFKTLNAARIMLVEYMLPHVEKFEVMAEWEKEKTRDRLMELVGLHKVD